MEILVGNKKAEVKFTIGAWKRLKEKGITPSNIEDKLNEDIGETLFNLVRCSLTKESGGSITDEYIEENVDLSICDSLMKAIQSTTPVMKEESGKK